MGFIRRIGTISRYQKTKYDIFYWKIEGFSTWSGKAPENDYYATPEFDSKDLKKCWLRFFPNGASGKSGFIGFCFRITNYECSSVHLTLGLKTGSGRIEKWFSNYIFFPEKDEFGSMAFVRKSEFLKRKEELVPSDCLTVVICLSQDAVNILRDVADKTETGQEKENGDEEKKGVEKMQVDMAKLLSSGNGSDATIVVGESEFKVHSCILTARTPVFAALFEHDTLEKATRKITITDCEPAIFGEFLNYIYSGSVQDLSSENALGIYRVSDKYLVKDLKELCRSYIQDNMCPETFSEAVQLALRCKDEDLLETAFDYFAIHFRHIIRSVEWQRFIEENPREANEILIRSFGPP